MSFTINDIECEFSDGFEDYSEILRAQICVAVEEKYQDWESIMNRNRERMRRQFSESGETDIKGTWEILVLRYPEIIGDDLRFMIILRTDGYGVKHQRQYAMGMGKFKIPW